MGAGLNGSVEGLSGVLKNKLMINKVFLLGFSGEQGGIDPNCTLVGIWLSKGYQRASRMGSDQHNRLISLY